MAKRSPALSATSFEMETATTRPCAICYNSVGICAVGSCMLRVEKNEPARRHDPAGGTPGAAASRLPQTTALYRVLLLGALLLGAAVLVWWGVSVWRGGGSAAQASTLPASPGQSRPSEPTHRQHNSIGSRDFLVIDPA